MGAEFLMISSARPLSPISKLGIEQAPNRITTLHQPVSSPTHITLYPVSHFPIFKQHFVPPIPNDGHQTVRNRRRCRPGYSMPYHIHAQRLYMSHSTNTIQGASIARRFSKAYSVVVLARNPANFEPVVNEINTSGGQAFGISTDLSDTASVRSAFDQISAQYAGSSLAAAVFNSGGGFVRKPFLELTEEEFTQGYESQGYVS